MDAQRIFEISAFLQTSDDEPIRSIVTESPEAAIVAWQVLPGQRIAPHVHPHGQDTWTILSGEGLYQVDADGTALPIAAGTVVVAPTGAVHGVVNVGSEPLVFISVIAPAAAGFEPLSR